MTQTEVVEAKFQMLVLTAQGSYVHYGRPKTSAQCDDIRRTSRGFEGQHYRFERV